MNHGHIKKGSNTGGRDRSSTPLKMPDFNTMADVEKWAKKNKWSIRIVEDKINESIFYFSGTFDAGKAGKKKVTLPVVADDEKAGKKKFEDMINSHVKNGHLPKGKLLDIKVDSRMG